MKNLIRHIVLAGMIGGILNASTISIAQATSHPVQATHTIGAITGIGTAGVGLGFASVVRPTVMLSSVYSFIDANHGVCLALMYIAMSSTPLIRYATLGVISELGCVY